MTDTFTCKALGCGETFDLTPENIAAHRGKSEACKTFIKKNLGWKIIDKKEDDTPKNKATCSYIGQNFFADAVFSHGKIRFLKKKYAAGIEFCDSILTDEGKIFEPIRGDIDVRLLRLPVVDELGESPEDLPVLFEELKTAIRKVWDAGDEKNLSLLTLWICATYRFDLVGCAPYLRLRGPYGTGKTRGLDVISHLALRPLAIGPSLTEAVIFRLCETYKPCACLNEFDEKGHGDYSSVAVQLLNSRFERGHPIPRPGGENWERLDLFDPFGPTAFAARNSFSDTSLESRCLEIVCTETERDDISAILSPEQFEATFAPLRNRLYFTLRLSNSETAAQLPEETAMPRRFRQLLTALWAATHPALKPMLQDLIKTMRKEEQERLNNSDEGVIWWAIFEEAAKYEKEKSEFVLEGKFVGGVLGIEDKKAGVIGGKRLSAMGFKPAKKTREARPWVCTEKLWKKMLARAGYPESVALPWQFGGTSSDVSGTCAVKSGGTGQQNLQIPPLPLETSATRATTDESNCHTPATHPPQKDSNGGAP